ncbi:MULTISPECIES: 3-hydroxyacyl-CoA dehydrogenase NAD-binding domain-containing protein [Ramlibacter]|uniref:NAD-binding protein n=1 Tax=Ramlibacter aquaticus TaxID=2780094 RepID=A0ABR9SHG5_9BURK|nr:MULTISPECIES: 3-hydroxyacyl-CoA dehydrogenase NAD-binding domain-containing protein [Ramlibacter]MBE7941799.1 NAD-binding protein [Ramlibacter aquaticus]
MTAQLSHHHVAVIGGGTMGADVAIVFARGGARVTVVEPQATRAARIGDHAREELGLAGRAVRAEAIAVVPGLDNVDWDSVDLVVECITEALAPKQQLFAELVRRARPDALLTSNSSGIPISRIAEGLATAGRMAGLHFFMPAHLVPLVEVVLGPQSEPERIAPLMDTMRRCGSVPVLVRKDRPGFLANRLQHALSREAFKLIDEGVASPEDVDAAVRFGFGFRFIAAGPVLQRDHAGLDIHAAAGATIYPSLCNDAQPARCLTERVAAGRIGMKAGAGFQNWPEERRLAERARYDRLLRQGLDLLRGELPPLD